MAVVETPVTTLEIVEILRRLTAIIEANEVSLRDLRALRESIEKALLRWDGNAKKP